MPNNFRRTTLASIFAATALFSLACADALPPDIAVAPVPASTPLVQMDYKRDAALEAQLAKIAEAANGKVGIAAVMLDSGEAAFFNSDEKFPMQSVYKLPISMAVLDHTRLGNLGLDELVGVTKEDFVREGMRSPLRDDNPNGGEFTIRELIRLAMVESDGTASDVLMRLANGGAAIQGFVSMVGTGDMRIVNTEKELGSDVKLQYENYSSPRASIELLRWLDAAAIDPTAATRLDEGVNEWQLLMKFMAESVPGERRLKGELPKGTYIAHKTGTSGTRDGVTFATNDIGIIKMPNGKRFAIAVFVSDSPADDKTREGVIAKAAKAVWDKWNVAAK